MKWEDGGGTYVGIPSRVVQYEGTSVKYIAFYFFDAHFDICDF